MEGLIKGLPADEYHRQYRKKYYQEHKKECDESNKKYMKEYLKKDKNKEKKRTYSKKYHQEHREEINQYHRNYYRKHRKKIREKQRKYIKDFRTTYGDTHICLNNERIYTGKQTKHLKQMLPLLYDRVLKKLLKKPRKYSFNRTINIQGDRRKNAKQ